MNVKQAYKAFAAVPRSLAVLEPPQVGCDAWTVSGSQPETHAVVIGWSHPAPSSLELAAPCRRGLVMCCDVWNALIFLILFFLFFLPVLKCHLGPLVLIHSSIHGEHRELISISLMHYFYLLPGL